MSGLEALVLFPLVYGCVHLGKKVLAQSRVIDNQNALIDVQRETISGLQTTGGGGGGSGSGWHPLAQRAVAFSGIAVAASMVAYNTHRWVTQSNRDATGGEHHCPPAPSDTYVPTLATNEQEECKICCEYQRDTLLLPCRHFALCWLCAAKVLSSEDAACRTCPICRKSIASAQFTFVS